MIIYPACDLINGQCVRLYKGDYNEMKVYNNDPPAQAEKFKKLGATHLHIVDLDGAKKGEPVNHEIIAEMKKRSGLFCEVGGGIRTIADIERYVSMGIDRVILGTAVTNSKNQIAEEAVAKFGKKIAVSVDVKDGYVAVKGWTKNSPNKLVSFLDRLVNYGVKTVIVTDISKDGALKGPNHDMYKEISEKYDLDLIASGGVTTVEDVISLKDAGMAGAIIGKAYYEGMVDLKKCLEAAK